MKLRSFAFAALLLAALPSASPAAVGISINIAPPLLPIVEQPPCPVDGYLWTPGYWAYGEFGYYWVPGFWVAPPAVGLLWTPPYWGFNDGVYVFHSGYWAPEIGFYGGINYGYGYFGSGYYGGRWDGNIFRYNTAITRVNTKIVRNTYVDRTVVNKQVKATRASYNGPGGVKAAPSAREKAVTAAHHVPPTSQQLSQRQAASKNRDLQAAVNKGRPKSAAIRSLDEGGKAKVAEAREAGAEKSRNQSAARKEQQSVERRREETTGNLREGRPKTTAAEVRERESAAARRRMTERSRRPDVVVPREAAAEQDRRHKEAKRRHEEEERR